jgi:predicted TIM-barrel fold metal-dependent hydrolase
MSRASATRSGQLKARLDHPVIDADGHTIEVTPVLRDFVDEVGGHDAAARFDNWLPGSTGATYEERRENWTIPFHWTWPARNTLDRATAALPRLYYERMDEIGLDFSLVYPTQGLRMQMISDQDLRPVVCRALNMYMAELHAGLSDRILPVAAIPMHTPQEAISEIEYAVGVLGMRAILIPSYVCRPIPRVHRAHPEYDDVALRFDTYGIDSEHDYDPVWAKCGELRLVPSVHTASHGFGFRRSISSYVYNHIGSFSTSCEAVCKSLLMGGVFHRFPTLKLAALEGGMGWATSLYADFVAHWAKRNGNVIHALDPATLDGAFLASLLRDYGSGRVRAKSAEVLESIVNYRTPPETIDEFSACPFETAEEIRDLFVSHIFIGCEADDPMNALAFDSRMNPLGARFRPIFGSDISHWDVPDVSKVLDDAYELVERELITGADFREFTFSNAAFLYAGTNPSFFAGTAVEGAVDDLLRASTHAPGPPVRVPAVVEAGRSADEVIPGDDHD